MKQPDTLPSWVNYDAAWKHTDPYPRWPFTRVNPKELAKVGKYDVAAESEDDEPAPF